MSLHTFLPPSRLVGQDYDILRIILGYYTTPHECNEGHDGSTLISCLVVNKLWAHIVTNIIWKNIRTDRTLWRVLFLHARGITKDEKLELIQCSHKKIPTTSIPDIAWDRLGYYASLVADLEVVQDRGHSTKPRCHAMWHQMAGRLHSPMFPKLRRVAFSIRDEWKPPVIFEGARPTELAAKLYLSQKSDGWIKEVTVGLLSFFQSVEKLVLDLMLPHPSMITGMAGAFDQFPNLKRVDLRLFWSQGLAPATFAALQSIDRLDSLTLYTLAQRTNSRLPSSDALLPKLSELVYVMDGAALLQVCGDLPVAPGLKSVKFTVETPHRVADLEETFSLVTNYHEKSPFTSLVYDCDQGWRLPEVIRSSQIWPLTKLAGMLHIDIRTNERIQIERGFLLGIANASPGLLSLKLLGKRRDDILAEIHRYTPILLEEVILFTSRCPNLSTLHLLVDARPPKDRRLLVSTDGTTPGGSGQLHWTPEGDSSDLLGTSIEPHRSLCQLSVGNSLVSDHLFAAEMLSAAYPLLEIVDYEAIPVIEREHWSNVNRSISRLKEARSSQYIQG
ncbi:hypothetical protein FRC14_001974 [Serendipita sp. 396]|nr:hypothetical protein FRC14_001974 [Serendipita sp. 396]KAG8802043.1 hypothetical protein FRC16_010494 [Serendipita sp. 398]KAG8822940.1 hypothetical protein FRC19_004934 [Serendipita sp. 401]KAG8839149.1 hypothetical protein FRC18_000536 [Serendipita sp. 400]KAG8867836.1 hypothetical protein FRC20_004750 [Serendipita sp. 405]KAG9054702.1 hypothetical protein FS842_004418 [Serendipita sp. 407]